MGCTGVGLYLSFSKSIINPHFLFSHRAEIRIIPESSADVDSHVETLTLNSPSGDPADVVQSLSSITTSTRNGSSSSPWQGLMVAGNLIWLLSAHEDDRGENATRIRVLAMAER